MKSIGNIIDKATNYTRLILSSNRFFYAVLVVAVIQAAWYALSFQPTLFDEGVHLGATMVYSQSLNPFLGSQNPSWDYLGEIVREGSYLYYYIMGYPLRFVQAFTQDYMTQVVFLRFINILFFVVGVVIYRKVLIEATRGSHALVHATLLFFILTPAVALLPGSVNYDNLVFMVFALVLLQAVRLVKSEVVRLIPLVYFISVGLLICVIKWTSIALVAPVFAFVGYVILRKYLKASNSERSKQFDLSLRANVSTVGVFLLLLISLGLFIERPVYNYFSYGKPDPACQKVLTHDRCLNFPGYAIYYEIDQNKPKDFKPIMPTEYFLDMWAPGMLLTQVSVLPPASLPVMKWTYFTLIPLGLILLLVYLRDFLKTPTNILLLFVATLFTLILMYSLYKSYIAHGIPAAIRSRYLIPIMPIFLYFILASYAKLLGGRRLWMISSFAVLLVIFTQGGSLISYLLTAPPRLYWPVSKEVNMQAKKTVAPFVKE